MPISDRSAFPSQWDVVVLPFPYADRFAEKRRAAVDVIALVLAQLVWLIWF